jgi:hypothetical protein
MKGSRIRHPNRMQVMLKENKKPHVLSTARAASSNRQSISDKLSQNINSARLPQNLNQNYNSSYNGSIMGSGNPINIQVPPIPRAVGLAASKLGEASKA